MKEKIKQILLIFFFIAVVVFPLNTNARSGCCSHHGGVCGCRCCDGTSLSAKCAPYYSQCSRPIEQKLIIPTTSMPPKLEITGNTLPVGTYNPSEYTAQVSNKNKDNSSLWFILIGSSIVGFIIDSFLKRK